VGCLNEQHPARADGLLHPHRPGNRRRGCRYHYLAHRAEATQAVGARGALSEFGAVPAQR
jgi:hypothetical protein